MHSNPIFVDLDRTFVRHDTYWQDICYNLRKKPWRVFIIFYLYVRFGLGESKYRNASWRFALTKEPLDYLINPEFYQFLTTHNQQRTKYLFTGASQLHADLVAKRFPIFKKVYSSSRKVNFSVQQKLRWLDAYQKNQAPKFDYAGDRSGDWPIFRLAQQAYVVNPSFLLVLRLLFCSLPNTTLFDVPNWKKTLLKLNPRTKFFLPTKF